MAGRCSIGRKTSAPKTRANTAPKRTRRSRLRTRRISKERKRTMRLTRMAILTGVALLGLTASAQAAWHGYISHSLGFAFAAPGELKVGKGTYSGALAGT